MHNHGSFSGWTRHAFHGTRPTLARRRTRGLCRAADRLRGCAENPARAAVWILAGADAATGILVGTRRPRAAAAPPGRLLAISACLVAAGWADQLLDRPAPAVRVALPLLAYLLTAAAVLLLRRDRTRHDRSSLIDALIVTVAAAQIGWVALLEPMLGEDSASLGRIALAGSHGLGYLLVIGVLARLGFAVAGARDTAARLLIGGIGLARAQRRCPRDGPPGSLDRHRIGRGLRPRRVGHGRSGLVCCRRGPPHGPAQLGVAVRCTARPDLPGLPGAGPDPLG